MSLENVLPQSSSQRWEKTEILTYVAVGSLVTAGVIAGLFGAVGILTQAQLLPGALAGVNPGLYASWILVGTSAVSFTGACVLGVCSCMRKDSRGEILLDFEHPASESSSRVEEIEEKSTREPHTPPDTEMDLGNADFNRLSESLSKSAGEKVEGKTSKKHWEQFCSALQEEEIARAGRILNRHPKEIDLSLPFDDGKECMPPLHLAVLAGKRAVVEFLIENGAPINQFAEKGLKTSDAPAIRKGFTPLMLAMSPDSEIANYLIEKGATRADLEEPDAQDAAQEDPLEAAIARDDERAALLIIKNMVLDDKKVDYWSKILILVAGKEWNDVSPAIIERLTPKGSNPDADK